MQDQPTPVRYFVTTSIKMDMVNYQLMKIKLIEKQMGSFSDFVNEKVREFLSTQE